MNTQFLELILHMNFVSLLNKEFTVSHSLSTLMSQALREQTNKGDKKESMLY